MRRRWQIPQNMTEEQAEKRKREIEKSLEFHQKWIDDTENNHADPKDDFKRGTISFSDYEFAKDLYHYHYGMTEILKQGYLYPGELPDDLLKKYFPYITVSSDDLPDYVCFDLETTGLGSDSSIIDIGAVKVRNGKIVDTFSSLVRSPLLIPRNITALTGITIDENIKAPVASDVLPKFIEFIGKDTLVGHNIKTFDCPILKRHCDKIGVTVTNKICDSLEIARDFLPNLQNHKLPTLCAYYSIKNRSAHRALPDAEANHYIFQNLCYGAPGEPQRIPEKPKDTNDREWSPVGENVKQLCKVLYGALYNGVSTETIGTVFNWFDEHPVLKSRKPYEKIFQEIQIWDNDHKSNYFFNLFLDFIKENYYVKKKTGALQLTFDGKSDIFVPFKV